LKITIKNNPEIIEIATFKRAVDRALYPNKYKNVAFKNKERFKNEILDRERRVKIKETMDKNFSKFKSICNCETCGKDIVYSINNNYIPRFCSIRCARAKQITPKRDTSIEIKIQNFLKQLEIDFMTHQYIKDIEHGYQCDIFIPSMNLVIECDGNYWHKYPTGTDIDHIRTSELISKGFRVLRLWEFEINEMTIDKFKEKLNG